MRYNVLHPAKHSICIIAWLFIVIIPIGWISTGWAEVSFSCSVYNTADCASETVSGENLNFGGIAVIEKDLVAVTGKGSTVNNQSFYSYELACKGDRLQSAARTDSGVLSWGGSATAAYNGSSASISSRAFVSDGNYSAYYRNADVAASERIQVMGLQFQETAKISPHLLSFHSSDIIDPSSNYQEEKQMNNDSWRDGELDDNSSGEDICGLDQSLLVEGFGRWLRIDTAVVGNTSLHWLSGVDSSQSGYSLKTMVTGAASNESDIQRMEMKGYGTGFPPQILPAGKMNVKEIFEVNPNSTIDANFVDEEIACFNLEKSINESLNHWYNLNQSSIVNLTGTTSGGEWNMVPGVRFRMKMSLDLDS